MRIFIKVKITILGEQGYISKVQVKVYKYWESSNIFTK